MLYKSLIIKQKQSIQDNLKNNKKKIQNSSLNEIWKAVIEIPNSN